VACSVGVMHSVLLFCQLATRNPERGDVNVDAAIIAAWLIATGGIDINLHFLACHN
jgi:hypothetical protein